MIVTDKKIANEFDVVVRTGKFPTQGTKVVLTKGSTKISFPLNDIPYVVKHLACIALGNSTSD